MTQDLEREKLLEAMEEAQITPKTPQYMQQTAQQPPEEKYTKGYKNFLELMVILMANYGQKGENGRQQNSALDDVFGAILGFKDVSEFRKWRDTIQDKHLTAEKARQNWEKRGQSFDYDKAADLNVRDSFTKTKHPLLDLISRAEHSKKNHESGNNYNIVYGGKKVNLTDMSINEVLKWQKQYTDRGSASSAAGRYQILRGTLEGLKKNMGLTGKEKFDENMQDRMAVALMDGRGYSKFMAGKITEAQFMKNLSKEWASFAKDMSGKSYYAGDGLNKARVGPQEILTAMRDEKTLLTTEKRREEFQEMNREITEPRGVITAITPKPGLGPMFGSNVG